MDDQTRATEPRENGVMNQLLGLVRQSRLMDAEQADTLDRNIRTRLAEISSGFSVLEIALAYVDWASHLAIAPGKRWRLQEDMLRKLFDLGVYGLRSALRGDPPPPVPWSERRLGGENWQRWPFNVFAQNWMIWKGLSREATRDVPGVRPENLELITFLFDQVLEVLSPANFPVTNPDVIRTTVSERGRNLARGLSHLVDDVRRSRSKEPPPGTERFEVGKEVACTPGKVIYQNRLVELIQYAPQTEQVDAEPVFIVPAWIMKYYILDLSPRNSLVRYLVEQGKTVFMVSWKNPGREDADLTMDDYLELGLLEPLDAVRAILPKRRINAVGYCIGGTLLYIAAAHLAGERDLFNSLTIFAAQADFSEAGEIRAMIGESIFSQLEALMQKRGVLEASQMGGAFAALRSGDLVWGPAVDRYLLGKESFMNDLMAWNADGTRMPHRMHAEYLRTLYLDNDLAEARFKVRGRTICMTDIDAPMFVVGTVTDHVAPWKSVYKIHRLNGGDVTFLLTTGGHNAGIVSGPSHPRRKHQLHTRVRGERYMDPETWQASVPVTDGSWWPAWIGWLEERSSGKRKPPAMGASRKGYKPLRDAPGEYVLMR
jgi:polyhydroxyalkanoate synthase